MVPVSDLFARMAAGYSLRGNGVFLGIAVLMHIGLGISHMVFNLFLKASGLPPELPGQVSSAGSLGLVLGLMPAGWLGDRVGQKPLMLGGMILAGGAELLRILVPSTSALFLGSFLYGLGMAAATVNFLPYLATRVGSEDRLGTVSAASSVTMMAMMVGGLVAGTASDLLRATGWTDAAALRFVLAGGAGFLLAAGFGVAGLTMDNSRETAEGNQLARELAEGAFHWGRALFWRLAVFGSMIGLGAGLFMPYMNLYFVDRYGINYSTVGIISAVGMFLTSAAMLFCPAIVARLGRVQAVAVLQIASLPFLLGISAVPVLAMAMVCLWLRQMLMQSATPIASEIALSIAGPKARGLANSISSTSFQVGAVFGAPIGGLLVKNYGYGPGFWGGAGLYLMASLFYLLMMTPLTGRESISVAAGSPGVPGIDSGG